MKLRLILDRNECESGAHRCDQVCVNTEGSYTCACNDGFTLSSDSESCTGPLFSHSGAVSTENYS